ncbi:BNR repeat-like domain protein, partial [Chlamydia psittaci 84-8471/1]
GSDFRRFAKSSSYRTCNCKIHVE